MFETTITDIRIDTQTYVRAKQMLYLLQTQLKPFAAPDAMELAKYVEHLFEKDSSKLDFKFANDLLFEYAKAYYNNN